MALYREMAPFKLPSNLLVAAGAAKLEEECVYTVCLLGKRAKRDKAKTARSSGIESNDQASARGKAGKNRKIDVAKVNMQQDPSPCSEKSPIDSAEHFENKTCQEPC